MLGLLICDKENWLPSGNPKHQGIDPKEGMGITEENRRTMHGEMSCRHP